MRQIQVTENGEITGLPRQPQVPCPTCKRTGRVIRADCIGRPLSYYNPVTGSSFPEETCRTCNGDGWISPEDANRIKGG